MVSNSSEELTISMKHHSKTTGDHKKALARKKQFQSSLAAPQQKYMTRGKPMSMLNSYKSIYDGYVVQCSVQESHHVHAQAPRDLGQGLDCSRCPTAITVLLRYSSRLLLNVRNGAHDTIDGRVTASGAGLR